MWTEQDDFDEETDMLIFDMSDELEKKSSGSNNSGSCLIFFLFLSGFVSLPVLGVLWLIS